MIPFSPSIALTACSASLENDRDVLRSPDAASSEVRNRLMM
jgi:hypothetical protein